MRERITQLDGNGEHGGRPRPRPVDGARTAQHAEAPAPASSRPHVLAEAAPDGAGSAPGWAASAPGTSLITGVAAGISMAVGSILLAGWIFDVPALRASLPGITNPMVVLTAIAFLLVGLSLALLRPMPVSRRRRLPATVAAAGAVSIGLLALAQYAFGWDLGIDRILLTGNAGRFPGKMAVPAAAGFVLVGAALLLLDLRTRRGRRPAEALLVAALPIPILGLLGHLYGVPSFASLVAGTATMALHTAATFLIVVTGALAARPDGIIRTAMTAEGPGSVLVRRLVPPASVLLIAIGWLRLVGERAGLYGPAFGVAVMVVASVAVLSGLILVIARSLNAAEAIRELAHARLLESEQRQAALLRSLGDGVLTTDTEGRILSINPALTALAGWREDEVAGRLYDEVYPLLDNSNQPIPPQERHLSRAMMGRKVIATRGYEMKLVTRDGRRMPVNITAAPVLKENGEVVGGVDVIRDVSHEREVDALKSSLVSTVSHELRTPLTMIKGFSELLLSRTLAPEQSMEAARQINTSADRLNRLIENLLSVSRIEANRIDTSPERLRLDDVLDEVLPPFERERPIETLVADGLPAVWADRDHVVRIVTNLVSNAIKYSDAGTPITVACSPSGSSVHVSVTDEGIGLTKEDAAKLFDKFFRVDDERVRTSRGTGLGLYITKGLVQLQGGRIWVESEPGKGSTFTFSLPVADGPGTEAI